MWRRRRCYGTGHELLALVAIKKKRCTCHHRRVGFRISTLFTTLLTSSSTETALDWMLLHTRTCWYPFAHEHEDYITKIRGAPSSSHPFWDDGDIRYTYTYCCMLCMSLVVMTTTTTTHAFSFWTTTPITQRMTITLQHARISSIPFVLVGRQSLLVQMSDNNDDDDDDIVQEEYGDDEKRRVGARTRPRVSRGRRLGRRRG